MSKNWSQCAITMISVDELSLAIEHASEVRGDASATRTGAGTSDRVVPAAVVAAALFSTSGDGVMENVDALLSSELFTIRLFNFKEVPLA